MIPITLWLPVIETPMGNARTYKLEVKYPAVPRIGDTIEITDGGWTEEARFVWWHFDGTISIEFAPHVRDSAGPEMLALTNNRETPHQYMGEEDFEGLEPAGWVG